MILDGYWKKELKHNARLLAFWIKVSDKVGIYAEHKVNKYILYSAVIIRKMFEDEKGAETVFKKLNVHMPALELIKYKVKVTTYPFSGNKNFIIERAIPENYNQEEAVDEEIPLNTLCNQIIHSFVWSVVHEQNSLKICEVLFASDKEKANVLYALNPEDFIKAINFCIEKGTI